MRPLVITDAVHDSPTDSGRAQVFRSARTDEDLRRRAHGSAGLGGVDLDLWRRGVDRSPGAVRQRQTTLLNNLGGLDVPTAGELSYRDIDLTTADEDELTRFRRERVGFIFQFYNPDPQPDRGKTSR